MKRELTILLVGWLVLAAGFVGIGRQNLSAPGLYYDEAIYGGLTRDFLAGQPAGGHMPEVTTLNVFGGPFPYLVQPYLGALKCWLLLPAFKLFGSTTAVLRGANLFFSVAALLIFMSWTWRLLGLAEALLAGLLLASDPAFFFPGVMDWGSVQPAFLCRFGGLFLALLAWRRQQLCWALAAGFVLGLGFFNKIDFGVCLAGVALAAVCAGGRSVRVAFRVRPKIFFAALLGFVIGAGPAVWSLLRIIRAVYAQHGPTKAGEFAEKCHTLRAMYDGSYFYRLMNAGGPFDKMNLAPAPVWTPFGIVVLLAAGFLVVDIIYSKLEDSARATKIFLLLSTIFITVGLLILPEAVRIHHTIMVYPFPHLLIAAAVVTIWRRRPKLVLGPRTAGGLAGVAVALLVVCNVVSLQRTEQLIRETGGRGWWSTALEEFADEIATRSDVTVSSLDWGFNEQMEFWTRGVQVSEPYWRAVFGLNSALPCDPQHVYLVHPPEFSLSPFGAKFMEYVAREYTNAVVEPWRDRQGNVAFYSIAFRP